MKPARGFAPILIILAVILISTIAFLGIKFYLNGHNVWTKEGMLPLKEGQSKMPEPTPSPFDETVYPDSIGANWKTYQTDKFSISYPPDWVLDYSYPDQFDISFKSVDYGDDGGFPTILKGFQVHLYIGRGQGTNPSKLGLVNTEPAMWLGKKASLDKIGWGGTMVRLWTNENSRDLFMSITTPPSEKPQFKTFEDNKEDFLAVANSLKLK